MTRHALWLAAVVALFATAAPADEFRSGALVIKHPWIAHMPASLPNRAGYLAVSNTGSVADRLIAVEATFSKMARLHQTEITDGVARMRPIHGGLEIAPGQTVVLEPGGRHVMFMKVSDLPDVGQAAEVTLVFERGGRVVAPFIVMKRGGRKHKMGSEQ